MRNKIGIVTGGAQGIGKAIVLDLLNCGMRAAVFDVDAEALGELRADVADAECLLCCHCDVSEEEEVARAVADTVRTFGRLDVLVNNAVYGQPPYGPFESMGLEEWNQTLKVNMTGPLLMAKYSTPHLRLTKGCIINIASTLALHPEPHCEAIAASKGGLISLTRALAASLAPEVRVNSISPGWIEVGAWRKASLRQRRAHSQAELDHHPVGRVGVPQDIASLVTFLAGERSGFITGENFVVDGGVSRRILFPQ